jgi:hypothetical protein
VEGLPDLEDGFWFWRHNRRDQPSSNEPTFGLAFIETPPVCLEGREALQISPGVVWFIQSPRGYGHRDGQWTALLVPKSMRPNLSEDERSQLWKEQRALRERLQATIERSRERLQNGGRPPSEEARRASEEKRQAWLNGPGNIPRMLRIRQQTGAASTFLEFDAMPGVCVEAFGELWLNQEASRFPFRGTLPTIPTDLLLSIAALMIFGRNC